MQKIDSVLNDGDTFLVKLPNKLKKYLTNSEQFSLNAENEYIGNINHMAINEPEEEKKEEENPENIFESE